MDAPAAHIAVGALQLVPSVVDVAGQVVAGLLALADRFPLASQCGGVLKDLFAMYQVRVDCVCHWQSVCRLCWKHTRCGVERSRGIEGAKCGMVLRDFMCAVQAVQACKEAVKAFLERVGDLSGMLLRLLEETNAGASAPEQLSRFEALLQDAKATVKVRTSVCHASRGATALGCHLLLSHLDAREDAGDRYRP